MQQQAKSVECTTGTDRYQGWQQRYHSIDIRLVCATNLPLAELANENRFQKRPCLPHQ